MSHAPRGSGRVRCCRCAARFAVSPRATTYSKSGLTVLRSVVRAPPAGQGGLMADQERELVADGPRRLSRTGSTKSLENLLKKKEVRAKVT